MSANISGCNRRNQPLQLSDPFCIHLTLCVPKPSTDNNIIALYSESMYRCPYLLSHQLKDKMTTDIKVADSESQMSISGRQHKFIDNILVGTKTAIRSQWVSLRHESTETDRAAKYKPTLTPMCLTFINIIGNRT